MLERSGLPVSGWVMIEQPLCAAFALYPQQILPQDSWPRDPVCADDLLVAGDVRIDNREELADRLGLDSSVMEAFSDNRLFRAAWGRWQRAAVNFLCGGFAVAVWDKRTATLTLLRDHVGERPLYYLATADACYFASMPQALTAAAGVDTSLDADYLVDYVTLTSTEPSRCCFRNVRKVSRGSMVTWKQGQVVSERYWHPLDTPPIHFRRDEEYVEALLERFDQAVACRLRSRGGVATQLSGGMDSSSVTATAARLMHGRELTAFTAVPRSEFSGGVPHGRFGDEGPAAALVAAMYQNIDHRLIEGSQRDMMRTLETSGRLLGQPVFNPLNQMWNDAMYEQSRQHGINVMLIGSCGNSTMSFAGLIGLADLFRSGRWWKLVRQVRQLRSAGHTSWRGGAYWAAGSYLPMPLRRLVSPELRSFDLRFSPVHPDRARERNLLKTAGEYFFKSDASSEAFRRRAFEFYDAGVFNGAASAGWGISVRDPMQDRRMFEYCFAIPIEQYLVGGQTRSLVRRAMKDRLPKEILACTTRGLQAADWYLTMGGQLPRLREEVALIRESPTARYVLDVDRLERLVDTWPSSGYEKPEVYNSYHFALSRGIAAGNFIRHVESGRWVD